MQLFLHQGAHETLESGACAMELTAWLAGEPHSDQPRCTSPVIASFMRRLNDRLNDEQRQELLPYCIRVIGTNTGKKDDIRRGFLCADFATRVATPYWFDATGRPDLRSHADRLRSLPEITDRKSALAAREQVLRARSAAYAAAYADKYAAAAAYADAYAAASASADADADADVYAAAAADAAAYADARLRAWDALRAPALALIDRMCEIGARQEIETVESRVTEYRQVCPV